MLFSFFHSLKKRIHLHVCIEILWTLVLLQEINYNSSLSSEAKRTQAIKST